VKKPEPIVDYYGTKIEVDCALKSAGPAVYLERKPSIEPDADSTFDRLTPGQARELAKRLTDAAFEVERAGL
jgi:hypothetical protein